MRACWRVFFGPVLAVTLVVVGVVAAIGAAAGAITDPDRIVDQSPLPLPVVGTPVSDPDFGTGIRRLSDASDTGSFEAPVYSQLQAFSADERFVLLDSPDGYVIREIDGTRVAIDTSRWNVPRWDPSQPHSIVHFDANDNDTAVVQRTNVATGATSDLYTFPAPYRTVLNNQSFDELSRDGRWIGGIVTSSDGPNTIFALDLANRRLAVTKTIASLYAGPCAPDPTWGQVEPDWVGVSPLGRYLVIQWTRDGTDRCSGLETFQLSDGAFAGRAYDGHQHGDLGVDTDGTSEFFMTFELYHPSGSAAIGRRDLPGTATASPPRYLQVLSWGNEEHISCQGPLGACLVTAAGDPSNGYNPFENELFIQHTNGAVERLAHHRSSGCGYFAQARATWSASGRNGIFASDWNRGSGDCGGSERVDPYILAIDPNAAPPTVPPEDPADPGGTATPEPTSPTDVGVPGATPPPSPTGAVPPGATATPRKRQHLGSRIPRQLGSGSVLRLPRRTDEGTAINWKSRSRATCTTRPNGRLRARQQGQCVLVGHAMRSDRLTRWLRTYRIRVIEAQSLLTLGR